MSSKCCLNKLNRFPHTSCFMQRIKINIKSNKIVQKLGFGLAVKELWVTMCVTAQILFVGCKKRKDWVKVANTEGSHGRCSL